MSATLRHRFPQCCRYRDFASSKFWAKRYLSSGGQRVFQDSKGPDFHSRLRGFLDIPGPNPRLQKRPSREGDLNDTLKTFDRYSDEDFLFVVRRAVLIRQFIEKMHKDYGTPFLDADDQADIDRDLLDAFLLADLFKHGVRSMQAIFEMSSVQGEHALTKTALPSGMQYSMHVDRSFTQILLRDYRALRSGILQGALSFFQASASLQ